MKIYKTIIAIALVILLCGCVATRTEVKREAIDCRYTEPQTEVVTEYEHKFSPLRGEFVLVPNTHSVIKPGAYEILYRIDYDDGTTSEVWIAVDKGTYDKVNGGVKE